MKFSVITIILAGLFFIGCENTTNMITEPNDLQKEALVSGEHISTLPYYDIIPLPERSPIYLDSVFTISLPIVGEIGGRLVLDKFYVSAEGKIVTMLADLTIPPNAFSGVRTITLTVDKNFAAVQCKPRMVFNKPLILVQTFTGLDLNQFNSGTIDFNFINKNGTLENVERTALTVIKPLGIVTVLNAKINHFSKYGWVRKPND